MSCVSGFGTKCLWGLTCCPKTSFFGGELWHPFSTAATVVMRKSSHFPGADRIGPSWCGINTLAPCHSPDGAHTHTQNSGEFSNWMSWNIKKVFTDTGWGESCLYRNPLNDPKPELHTRNSNKETKNEQMDHQLRNTEPPKPNIAGVFFSKSSRWSAPVWSLNHRFFCDLL